MRDLTLRELQTQLPWTVHYHRDFRASPMSHKDFGHALLHVSKALGKLAAAVNDAEHAGNEFKPGDIDGYVADLVVCALRLANTCPGRMIDLQGAVENRIERKNGVRLGRPVVFNLIAHLVRQRAFSEKAFGPGTRAKGVIAHIRKELVEIEQDPTDLFEWIDVVLLALDGAWRAGHQPEEIAAGLQAKQARNEARQWPDWRTASEDGPIEHKRSTA